MNQNLNLNRIPNETLKENLNLVSDLQHIWELLGASGAYGCKWEHPGASGSIWELLGHSRRFWERA